LFGYKAIIFYTSRDTTKLAFLTLAVLVSGVLALPKLGFLDFITGGFDTGRFGGLPNVKAKISGSIIFAI
jgi:hypothetical protein